MILLNKFITNYNFNNELYSKNVLPRFYIGKSYMIGKKYEIFSNKCYTGNTGIVYISGIEIFKTDTTRCDHVKELKCIGEGGINIIINPYKFDYKSQYKIITVSNSYIANLFETTYTGSIFHIKHKKFICNRCVIEIK